MPVHTNTETLELASLFLLSYVSKTRGDQVLEQAVGMDGNREISERRSGSFPPLKETIGYVTGSKIDVDMATRTKTLRVARVD
jgi:hypothetical protein